MSKREIDQWKDEWIGEEGEVGKAVYGDEEVKET